MYASAALAKDNRWKDRDPANDKYDFSFIQNRCIKLDPLI